MAQIQKKKLGEYIEHIDFASDPNIHLFYQHLQAGLEAFKNPQQSPDESFSKYLQMLRIAESFLGAKFDVDFKKIREEAKKQTDDPTEQILIEIEKVAELLDKRTRKIKVTLVFKKVRDDENEKEKES